MCVLLSWYTFFHKRTNHFDTYTIEHGSFGNGFPIGPGSGSLTLNLSTVRKHTRGCQNDWGWIPL